MPNDPFQACQECLLINTVPAAIYSEIPNQDELLHDPNSGPVSALQEVEQA
jgi:hypothetical protein